MNGKKILCSLLIALALVIFVAVQGASAGHLDNSDVRVNGTTTHNQQKPAVATTSDGRSTVCWQHWNGSNWDIKAQRYDTNGNPQSGEINVGLGPNNQIKPDIAVRPSGESVITWQEHMGGDWDVFMQRLNANGNLVGGPVDITPWGFDQIVPSVAMDSTGNFIIAFQNAVGGTNDNIMYLKYRFDGVYISYNAVATGTNDERTPSIAMNSSGDFAVSWQEYASGNWDVLVRKFYGGGGSSTQIPVRANANQQGESDVAIDESGRFVVCWQEYLGSHHNVYMQRFGSSGSLAAARVGVADSTVDEKYPNVAASAVGSFVVTWQENRVGNWDVVSRRYNSNGASLDGYALVNTFSGNNQEYAAVGVDNNGGSFITWQADGNQDGSGTGIFRRRYSNISTTWYFAEGYTGPGFEEWLVLQNPNSTPTTAIITYMIRGEPAQYAVKALPANSRETVSVNNDVGYNKEVSIKVSAFAPIIAERPMYFEYRNKWEGGHNTLGATSKSMSWYFAEGYTGSGFEQWLTLQNPNPANAPVQIFYYFRDGSPPLIKSKTIPANSRETVSVNEDVGSNQEVSIRVWSPSQEIVAERPTYFRYQNKWSGGHTAVGANRTQNNWYFAEGYTGNGFDEWLSLQNPHAFAISAIIIYSFRGGGAPIARTVPIPANSRETRSVNADVGSSREVSINVYCASGLVAERPMYFKYQDKWDGGHNAFGAPLPQNQWYFAEGFTGGGFDEWLTLQNPNSTTASVIITYTFRGGSSPIARPVSIGGHSREPIDIKYDVGLSREVSIKGDSTQPIVAERPMYFNYGGIWPGGHNTIGCGL